MTLASKIGLGIAALGTAGILDAVEMAQADDVPSPLSGKARNLAKNYLMTRRSAWSDARSRQGQCTSATHTRAT